MSDKKTDPKDDKTIELKENPYNPDKKKPEDIARLFYQHDLSIIPVISKRGLLLGILNKKDLVAELSDIERVKKLKIDKLITNLTKKVTFDDLIPHINISEFIVINIFGEVQGRWSRLQLLAASESSDKNVKHDNLIEKQKDEQILEWIIYLILEFIPRALYALNNNNKTIFYNSLFEDLYLNKFKKNELDTEHVEKMFSDPNINELYPKIKNDDMLFFNKDLDVIYEKIPLKSNNKKIGFLIFCDKEKKGEQQGSIISGVDIRGLSLNEMLESIERQLIVDKLSVNKDIDKVAESFKTNKKILLNKINKLNINY